MHERVSPRRQGNGDYGLNGVRRVNLPRGPVPNNILNSIETSGNKRQIGGANRPPGLPYANKYRNGGDEYEIGLGGGSSHHKQYRNHASVGRAAPKIAPPVWWG